MVAMADTASTPAPAPTAATRVAEVREGIAARFDLSDRRNLAGLGVFLFCAGIVVGAKLMRGAATSVSNVRSIADGKGQPQPGTPPSTTLHEHPGQPCAGCREREIQDGRRIAEQAAAAAARRAAANAQGPSDADVDAAERAAAGDRQLQGVDGLKTFSAYAESTLDEALVTQGDSSVPEG